MSCSTLDHFSHPDHSLRLKDNFVVRADATCSVCYKSVAATPTYTCSSSNIACQKYYLHKSCAELPKQIIRDKQDEHPLTLQPRSKNCTSFFRCDACWEETNDYSYVCLTCDFWIHKKCAFTPPIIPAPAYHHHPLTLIFCIPDMLRYFSRYCPICKERVQAFCWSYYCHKCTFFVHLKCSTTTVSLMSVPYCLYF
ncbi:hypothetical protein DCAR_0207463 [Daucus carota subsp. sativus]|uniref:DC1 domain-containing protein n=1 Tax=Daucus carota subsp. sativus TaxID=79200 RepID=A0AAF1AM35_DAUCS|nr:hypothetical protein DCAR_0207463 [Daucus carota subsp. sativus]